MCPKFAKLLLFLAGYKILRVFDHPKHAILGGHRKSKTSKLGLLAHRLNVCCVEFGPEHFSLNMVAV